MSLRDTKGPLRDYKVWELSREAFQNLLKRMPEPEVDTDTAEYDRLSELTTKAYEEAREAQAKYAETHYESVQAFDAILRRLEAKYTEEQLRDVINDFDPENTYV